MRLVLLFVAAGLLAPTAAAGTPEELRQEWLVEVARLERALERYDDIAREQAESFSRLEAARTAVDEAIANPEVRVEELRRLESELTRARDAAVRQADGASEARERIYEALELTAELGARLEAARRQTERLVADSGAAGLWSIEWLGESGFGLLRLETRANLATGTYRLTNGEAGTLTGTATSRGAELEVVHSVDGTIGHLSIRLDAEGRTAEGEWRSMDVGGRRASSAAFRLERVE